MVDIYENRMMISGETGATSSGAEGDPARKLSGTTDRNWTKLRKAMGLAPKKQSPFWGENLSGNRTEAHLTKGCASVFCLKNINVGEECEEQNV